MHVIRFEVDKRVTDGSNIPKNDRSIKSGRAEDSSKGECSERVVLCSERVVLAYCAKNFLHLKSPTSPMCIIIKFKGMKD